MRLQTIWIFLALSVILCTFDGVHCGILARGNVADVTAKLIDIDLVRNLIAHQYYDARNSDDQSNDKKDSNGINEVAVEEEAEDDDEDVEEDEIEELQLQNAVLNEFELNPEDGSYDNGDDDTDEDDVEDEDNDGKQFYRSRRQFKHEIEVKPETISSTAENAIAPKETAINPSLLEIVNNALNRFIETTSKVPAQQVASNAIGYLQILNSILNEAVKKIIDGDENDKVKPIVETSTVAGEVTTAMELSEKGGPNLSVAPAITTVNSSEITNKNNPYAEQASLPVADEEQTTEETSTNPTEK